MESDYNHEVQFHTLSPATQPSFEEPEGVAGRDGGPIGKQADQVTSGCGEEQNETIKAHTRVQNGTRLVTCESELVSGERAGVCGTSWLLESKRKRVWFGAR